MIIVLDVSAAIQIVLKKDRMSYFGDFYQKASWVIAPQSYVSEITNVLWKYNRGKILSHHECFQYIEDGINLIDDFFPELDMWKEVLGESVKTTTQCMIFVMPCLQDEMTQP